MLYLFTALYCEAHIIIEQFRLKKVMESTHFQQFYSQEAGIRLTISGVGEIAASSAVSSVCTKYRPDAGDFLVNIGICAGTIKQEGIYLANKLTELATGKTFYPDILYRHSFSEDSLATGMVTWDAKAASDSGLAACGTGLYDMEAAAVYQAGSYFFGPHQMAFLKVISDNGTSSKVLKTHVEQLMQTYRSQISEFLSRLLLIGHALSQPDDTASMRTEEQLYAEMHCSRAMEEQLYAEMHCSRAMEESLRQHIRYAALAGEDYVTVIRDMYREGRLPCRDRREGKLRFEELKQRLL